MSHSSPSERSLKQALEWFFQLQSENCSKEDRQQFERWYNKSEENRVAYLHAESLWSNLNQLKKKNDIPGLSEARQYHPRQRTIRLLSIAAPLLVCSMLVSVGWMEYNAETTVYTTQLGEKRSVTLSDGSTIDLNTDTLLHVKLSPLRRKFTLDTGEAIFNVQREYFRAFDVYAGQLKIRDIGTRFNVRRHNEAISVAVLEGAVEINGEQIDEGFQRTYHAPNSATELQRINIDQVEAWKHGRLQFQQTPLKQVAAELERYHPIRFVFVDPAIAQETLSGMFDTDDLMLFVNGIERILPVKAKHLADKQLVLIDWAK